MSEFSVVDLIKDKRDGKELSKTEIELFIQQIMEGKLVNEQLGSMLMAIYQRDMTVAETTCLTEAMKNSGDVLTWPAQWKGQVVDKHSTGGVGDKASLPLTPALAACGLKVPMISGRGLGVTGGTLDKLEAIPGLSVSMSPDHVLKCLQDVGCCIIGQTDSLVPADKVMYPARDVTGTVESLPLIVGSIISKKAAESPDALVLEVTYGTAAPMKNIEDARKLGQAMINTGNGMGIKTTALLTRMDDPVGDCVGNSLEVIEAVQCLQGGGPDDLKDLVCQLGGDLLYSVGKAKSRDQGTRLVEDTLQDGSAMEKFKDMVVFQGASRKDAESLATDPETMLPLSEHVTKLTCNNTGYVHRIDAYTCGQVCHRLGAGRTKPEDMISFGVGLKLAVRVGDRVTAGDQWVTVYTDDPLTEDVRDLLTSALCVKDSTVAREDMQRVTGHME